MVTILHENEAGEVKDSSVILIPSPRPDYRTCSGGSNGCDGDEHVNLVTLEAQVD